MPIESFANNPTIILNRGPIINVSVGHPLSHPQPEQSHEVPDNLHQTSGLLDTGASNCCINPSLAARLNLPIVGYRNSGDASGHVSRQRVRNACIGFILPNKGIHVIAAVGLTELPNDLQNHNIIIGRDVMSFFRAMYFSLQTGEYMIHF